MKKVLVSGAQGFLGSAVASYLAEKGYYVFRMTEDIRDKEKIRPYFKGIDFVIHTAGETKELHNKKLCYETNVLGVKNVIELCLQYGCKLIHFSSIAMHAPYGRSKQEGQKLVENACLNDGLKAVILRLCPIVKKDDPLMKWGRRYPLENLVEDIYNLIATHNFDNCEIIDYKKSDEKHSILLKS